VCVCVRERERETCVCVCVCGCLAVFSTLPVLVEERTVDSTVDSSPQLDALNHHSNCSNNKQYLTAWCCYVLAPGPATLQIYDEVVAELKLRGAYIMSPEECKKAGATIIKDGRLNADVVGQKATALARLFGFEVPPSTKVLVGEASVIGKAEPMSFEKLCPVLGEDTHWVYLRASLGASLGVLRF